MAAATPITQARRDRAKRHTRRAAWLYTIAFGLSLALNACEALAQGVPAMYDAAAATPLTNPIEVIDGDTIAAGGVRYRLSNIDAPELFSPECAAESMLAQQAALYLSAMLINADTVSVSVEGRDRYGRTLGRLWLNGEDAGALLIAAGVALPWLGRRADWCGGQ